LIYQIKGKLIKKSKEHVIVQLNNMLYRISIPETVSSNILPGQEEISLVIYHYINIDKNRGIPVLIGFLDELERDFFEKFISVSGVGPKAALKAFNKPVAQMAQAIEEGDTNFLKTLAGIGLQKAKQIIAHLQGKVGRFALMKEAKITYQTNNTEILEETKKILKRLQYNEKEITSMIESALKDTPDVTSSEELLNKIYQQKR